MKSFAALLALLLLSGCDNPGKISDEDYAEYQELGAPKILFTCTQKAKPNYAAYAECRKLREPRTAEAVEAAKVCIENLEEEEAKPIVRTSYTAGIGANGTYNAILQDARSECNGKVEILESES